MRKLTVVTDNQKHGQALYIDGQLVEEDIMVSASELASHIGDRETVLISSYYAEWQDSWAKGFPERLSEVEPFFEPRSDGGGD